MATQTPHPGPQPQAAKQDRPHTDDQHKEQAATPRAPAPAAPPDACLSGLKALDEHIRTSLKLAGPEGSGLYTLLDNLSVQTLGTRRSAFPTPAANPPGNYYRQQDAAPGVPGTSPPGPLPPSNQMGQGPGANSSAPLNQ